jgi:penicillin amidase
MHGDAYITYEKTYGVPYISGTTNESIAFAIGYSHAMDRLYDLNFHRAMAAGRLSEYFGKEALEFDRYMRSLQLSKIAARELLLLNTQNVNFLQAYTAGINEYMKGLTIRPIELLFSRISFEPWTIKDSLMIFKMFSMSFSEHWKLTALRTVIAHKWGKQLAERLVPFKDVTNGLFENIAAIDPLDASMNNIDIRLKYEQIKDTSFEAVADPGIDFKFLRNLRFRGKVDWTGSCAWAIHRTKAANGKILFGSSVNGAHNIPSELYMMSIKYPHGPNLMGSTMAGIPLILFGRNEDVAWSISTSFVENIDLYSIRISTDHRQYYYNGRWRDLEVSEEVIKVKGKTEVVHTVFKTHYGPVINFNKK